MPETQCNTAAMLSVGQVFKETLTFTRDMVDQYCHLCGDYNAIHRVSEAAAMRFPNAKDVVVPGGLIQIMVTGLFGSKFPGDGCLGLSFVPERFRKPVFPGDQMYVEIEVTRIRGPLVEVSVVMNDNEGEIISTATSKLMAADDAYRNWWQSQS